MMGTFQKDRRVPSTPRAREVPWIVAFVAAALLWEVFREERKGTDGKSKQARERGLMEAKHSQYLIAERYMGAYFSVVEKSQNEKLGVNNKQPSLLVSRTCA